MLSWRRLAALIVALPSDSATVRGVGVKGTESLWGSTEHLLASVIDATQMGNVMFANAHRRKGSRPTRFEAVRRPGASSDDGTRTRGTALPLNEMIALQRRWARGELDSGE